MRVSIASPEYELTEKMKQLVDQPRWMGTYARKVNGAQWAGRWGRTEFVIEAKRSRLYRTSAITWRNPLPSR